MQKFHRGRYLVQFTEHRTVEKELDACDAVEAAALAANVFLTFGLRAFSPVECDITGWTVCSLEPSSFDAAIDGKRQTHIAPQSPTPPSASGPLTMAEMHAIAELLRELRDTTLSQYTFLQVNGVMKRILSQCEACNAQEV